MNLGGKAAAPGNLGGSPNVLQMAHTVVAALLGGENHAVDIAQLLHGVIVHVNVHLIVAVAAEGGKGGGGGELLRLGTRNCAKGQLAVLTQSGFLVAGGSLGQHIVGIGSAFKQGVLAGIGGGGGLAAVGDGDFDLALVGDAGEFLQGYALAHLDGEGDAGDVGAVGVYMIRAAHQAGGTGLVQGCGGHAVHCHIVLKLCGVEVRIGDVHQHIAGGEQIQAGIHGLHGLGPGDVALGQQLAVLVALNVTGCGETGDGGLGKLADGVGIRELVQYAEIIGGNTGHPGDHGEGLLTGDLCAGGHGGGGGAVGVARRQCDGNLLEVPVGLLHVLKCLCSLVIPLGEAADAVENGDELGTGNLAVGLVGAVLVALEPALVSEVEKGFTCPVILQFAAIGGKGGGHQADEHTKRQQPAQGPFEPI